MQHAQRSLSQGLFLKRCSSLGPAHRTPSESAAAAQFAPSRAKLCCSTGERQRKSASGGRGAFSKGGPRQIIPRRRKPADERKRSKVHAPPKHIFKKFKNTRITRSKRRGRSEHHETFNSTCRSALLITAQLPHLAPGFCPETSGRNTKI